jgi:hypothetical protein
MRSNQANVFLHLSHRDLPKNVWPLMALSAIALVKLPKTDPSMKPNKRMTLATIIRGYYHRGDKGYKCYKGDKDAKKYSETFLGNRSILKTQLVKKTNMYRNHLTTESVRT